MRPNLLTFGLWLKGNPEGKKVNQEPTKSAVEPALRELATPTSTEFGTFDVMSLGKVESLVIYFNADAASKGRET
jgi:hypothetical protein